MREALPRLWAAFGLACLLTPCATMADPGRGRRFRVEFELERRGAWLEAAKAHVAVVIVAQRLGAYQKGIRSGLRALELLKKEREALESRGPVEALRRAQRAALQDVPQPFFWAAFGLTGTPR